MDVRKITNKDVGAVIELWRRCDLTRPWNDPLADIKQARRSKDAAVLIGWVDEELAASVMIGFDGHRGWIYYLAIDPDVQRQGHGRTMMNAAEHRLRERGAPKLQLMVRETNATALGFYERLGLERQPVVTLGK